MKLLPSSTILPLLLILCHSFAFAQRSLIIPSVQSLHELRTAERLASLFPSIGLQSTLLLHNTERDLLLESSLSVLSYGDADALRALTQPGKTSGNLNTILLEQIKQSNILSTISRDRYQFLVCNPEDPICQYINQHVKFDNHINLIYTCPKQWSDIFDSLPSSQSFTAKIISLVLKILRSFFSTTSESSLLRYHSHALYLSQCFQPFFNPQPALPNLMTVGSFIGAQAQRPLPDAYRKPLAKAYKIIFVALPENEPFDSSILTETAKAFPQFVFFVISGNVDIGTYALGNIVIDKHAPLNELFASEKAGMLISSGELTLLLDALYHSVPVVTFGWSRNGEAGRQLVRDKGCGVDVLLSSTALIDAIREVNFNGGYKTKAKDVSIYLNSQNTHYLIPNLIYNFFSAKGSKGSSDL